MLAITSSSFFSGPIPPPELLAAYEQVCPGSADKIIQRFETQSEHRMRLERTVIIGNARRATAGLILGFVVCLVIVGGSIYLGLHGQPWLAGTLVTGALSAVVGTFVYGKESAKNERIEKNAILQTPQRPHR
jgi:uncharacterized membrane protein